MRNTRATMYKNRRLLPDVLGLKLLIQLFSTFIRIMYILGEVRMSLYLNVHHILNTHGNVKV
jgi:hypothetical protein